MLIQSCVEDFQLQIDALVVSQICAQMPVISLNISKWNHLSNITLADSTFNVPGKIDLLLGAEVFPLILEGSRRVGGRDYPVAIKSSLG